MPTYQYECSSCKYQFEAATKIVDRKIPEGEPCPECKLLGNVNQVHLNMPGFGDPVKMGFSKPSDGFRDVLRKIHSRTAGSQLDQTSTIGKI